MQAIAYLQQLLPARKTKDTELKAEYQQPEPILCEIAEVTRQLQNIRNRFDFETQPDMIDSCIFQERALLSRYSHLISMARNKGLKCTPTMHYSLITNNR